MEWLLVKTLLSLAAVIALMVGVVFLLKKYVVRGQTGSASIVEMKLLGTMMIQPKRSIAALKVMNKVIIIGLSEQGMHALGEVSDEHSLHRIDDRLAAQQAEQSWMPMRSVHTPTFARTLAMHLGKRAAKGSH